MSGRLARGLTALATGCLWSSLAFATERWTADDIASFLAKRCKGWRVSGHVDALPRKSLGSPPDRICRDVAAEWAWRLVEARKAEGWAGLSAAVRAPSQ